MFAATSTRAPRVYSAVETLLGCIITARLGDKRPASSPGPGFCHPAPSGLALPLPGFLLEDHGTAGLEDWQLLPRFLWSRVLVLVAVGQHLSGSVLSVLNVLCDPRGEGCCRHNVRGQALASEAGQEGRLRRKRGLETNISFSKANFPQYNAPVPGAQPADRAGWCCPAWRLRGVRSPPPRRCR